MKEEEEVQICLWIRKGGVQQSRRGGTLVGVNRYGQRTDSGERLYDLTVTPGDILPPPRSTN